MKDQWNAKLYDGSHSFVSKLGEEVIDLLAPQRGEFILDLGCGTGDLVSQLSEQGVNVEGIDKSINMVNQAKSKYPNNKFTAKDAAELTYHQEFDAVFSNAALHWMKQPKPVLQCVYNSLKQGGRFVAEFGGKGNVKIITDEVIKQCNLFGLNYKKEQFPWYFPSIGQYTSLMEEVGFSVTFAHHFDRPTQLAGEDGLSKWIEMFGAEMFGSVKDSEKKEIIKKVESNLRNVLYQDGNWIADYKRIRVMAKK
ncbi:class I SAM-dependent methyltransferase [Bacillus solitudinis]|uniref:class I SAM-dependent methyltransferase n=1 Tax=Bacillus solitudinis TaxID=2014074 RepID=UPI000C24902B|nr:class I SAM-dependent methyltransferase [Bacillus solitudinis]